MKHTILIAAASQTNLIPLMEAAERLLNKSVQIGFKVFYLEEMLQLQPVAAGHSSQGEIDRLVSKVENELLVEKYAREHGCTVELLREVEDEFTVLSQSSVADLIIVDLDYEKRHFDNALMQSFFDRVDCPVLMLPRNFDFECLVAVHDASKASVKVLKDFLKLFDESFTKMPFSLLMEEPENPLEIKRERVFINYLRLFFKDMGAQHIHDESIDSLFGFISNECSNPMLMVNNELGREIIKSAENFATHVLNHPIFISKD